VAPLFWSFRIMVGLGFFFIALFAFTFCLSARRQLDRYRWFLRLAAFCLPLPWISSELGWFVAEHGRQPWAIEGVLPTFLASSSVTATSVWFSLIGFVVFYTTLAIVDAYLMVRTVRIGPEIVDDAPARVRGAAQPAE
jgi:cytochrome d ubiquinol oxidase subunit I